MAKTVQSVPTAPAANVRCRYSRTVTGDGFFSWWVLFNAADEMLILSHSLLPVAKQTINSDARASPGTQTAVKDDTEEEKRRANIILSLFYVAGSLLLLLLWSGSRDELLFIS